MPKENTLSVPKFMSQLTFCRKPLHLIPTEPAVPVPLRLRSSPTLGRSPTCRRRLAAPPRRAAAPPRRPAAPQLARAAPPPSSLLPTLQILLPPRHSSPAKLKERLCPFLESLVIAFLESLVVGSSPWLVPSFLLHGELLPAASIHVRHRAGHGGGQIRACSSGDGRHGAVRQGPTLVSADAKQGVEQACSAGESL
ncbi:hypothetical protein VPH35_053245 [Triticum aestivum]